MEFQVLGVVTIRHDGAEINVGGPRQRAVLALLLLNRNQRVPADRIVDALWDEPPKSARNSVQRFVADLRSSDNGLSDRLSSDRAGYTLQVDAGELDLDRFEAASTAATEHASTGDDDAGAGALRSALDEWNGSPIDGVSDPPFALLEHPGCPKRGSTHSSDGQTPNSRSVITTIWFQPWRPRLPPTLSVSGCGRS